MLGVHDTILTTTSSNQSAGVWWEELRSVMGEKSCVVGGVEVCGWGGLDVGGGSISVLL